jgi:MFS family permease
MNPRGASDTRLVVAARGVRAFVYGMLGVLLGVALSERGLSPVEIGAIITTSLVGDFCGTYVIGLNADRWGRRRTLVVLAALMAMTGVIFGLLSLYPLLLVAGFFGTLGTSASETAPYRPRQREPTLDLTAGRWRGNQPRETGTAPGVRSWPCGRRRP